MHGLCKSIPLTHYGRALNKKQKGEIKMATPHHPRRGSMGYSPRKRARSGIPHVKAWADDGSNPKLQGFAGYKVGMTHVLLVDYRPNSTTSGQEVMVPVTVIETPPMRVVGVRYYVSTPYGLRAVSNDADKSDVCDVRVVAQTQPSLITGIPTKRPETMEIRVGGGEIEDRIAYAESLINREVTIKDCARDGQMLDMIGVTKGKGYQGQIKRWHVKLLSHKNSKHRRMIGTQGPKNPSFIRSTVPQAGQMGYHQRTEYNKRLLFIGDKPEEINPAGGFVGYGLVRSSYVIIHGSVPGPVKRLIRMRDSVRYLANVEVEKPALTYVSLASKQGVGR